MRRPGVCANIRAERISIACDQAEVWTASLRGDADLGQLYELLSADEGDRAGRFAFERDRSRFVIARATLRLMLGERLRRRPQDIEFEYDRMGKPRLAQGGGLQFNASHSHELVVYALSQDAPVGVDVEWVRPLADLMQIARAAFSPGELAQLLALPREQLLDGFYNCWTRKEAYVKARGDGLSSRLQDFDVSFAPGLPAALLEDRTDPLAPGRWLLCAFAPAGGYVAALAVRTH